MIELVSEGELFDYIAIGGRFSETVSRTYFKMIMDGLKYMHGQGYCHRDIKPENLLLDSQFVLKIADFGFAAKLAGAKGDGILKERLGTAGYMAPEIYFLRYKGDKVDIFASGVVLFMMYSGHPPFQTAIASDPYFKLIREKKYLMFWSFHTRRKPPGFYSEDFQSLIEGMIAFDPEDRLSIDKILHHPWFAGKPLVDLEELRADFLRRREVIHEEHEKIRKLKAQKRSARNQASNKRYYSVFNRGNLNRDTADDITLLFLDLYEKQ